MDNNFFIGNRKKYLQEINDGSLSIFFAGSLIPKSQDQNYPFQINKNFYYLTGLDKPEFILLLAKGASMTREYLFIERGSEYASLWLGDKMTKEEASLQSGVNILDIYYLDEFKTIFQKLVSISRNAIFGFINDLYLDLERVDYDNNPYPGNRFALEIKEKYPYLRINNAYNILCLLRMQKNQCEVDAICDAIEITEEGIKALMVNARPEMKENELESYFDQVLKYKGTEVSFTTIAASGVNATVLHYDANNDYIKDDSLILFDLGCLSGQYCSDITRTFPVNGKFTQRQREIYEIVLNCNKECIKWLRPGVTPQEYFAYARRLLAEGLIKIGKIKDEGELSKYYYHNVGHFLGLDVHDVGEYISPLKEGNILTCEPGLYLRDEGIGIRIEDDVLITADGAINLSANIIKEIDDIEAFMAKYNKNK